MAGNSEEALGLTLPRALRRAWGQEPAPARRGPKASLTVDRIVAEAAQLADDEGIAGLSLIRVAERLGVTQNALYRYLDSRLELEILLREFALIDPPAAVTTSHWQPDARAWALAVRDRYTRHPWLADLQTFIPLTPNALGWLEALLAALESARLGAADTIRAATLIDGYVREQFATRRDLASWSALSPTPDVFAGVAAVVADRGMTRVSALFQAGLYEEPTGSDSPADFLFGLDRVLAGIAALAPHEES